MSRLSGRGLSVVLPLLLLLLAGLAAPLGALLREAVAERDLAPALPRTLQALRPWDGRGLPGDPAFEALAADLAALRAAGPRGEEALRRAAARLGRDLSPLAATLPRTADLAGATRVSRSAAVLVADPAWGEVESWAALRRAGEAYSAVPLLAAIGLRQDATGQLDERPGGTHQRARVLRALGGAALLAGLSLILAWPLAGWMARRTARGAGLAGAVLLLPLLAGELALGPGWAALLGAGEEAAFLATLAAVLPLMVLPLAAARRRAGPGLARTAAALGARPWPVFRRITWPQARAGAALGAGLVFTQALGRFAAPAWEDAAGPALASAARAGNWAEAGALSVWLLLASLLAGLALLRLGRARPR